MGCLQDWFLFFKQGSFPRNHDDGRKGVSHALSLTLHCPCDLFRWFLCPFCDVDVGSTAGARTQLGNNSRPSRFVPYLKKTENPLGSNKLGLFWSKHLPKLVGFTCMNGWFSYYPCRYIAIAHIYNLQCCATYSRSLVEPSKEKSRSSKMYAWKTILSFLLKWCFSTWWFQLLWKIFVKMGIFPK